MSITSISEQPQSPAPSSSKQQQQQDQDQPEWGTGVHFATSFWETERHRYEPSPWLLVRLALFYGFLKTEEQSGFYLYPKIVALAEEHFQVDRNMVALPAIIACGLTVFLVFALGYYTLIYCCFDDKPWLARYRIHKGNWPWKTAKSPKDWYQQLFWVVVSFSLNGALSGPPMLYWYFCGCPIPWRTDVESLPSATEILSQVLFFLFLGDCSLYHMHVLLHQKPFYYWIHKKHHQYKVPFGLIAAYTHPLDELLQDIGSALLGPLLLGQRMHLWTLSAWVLIAMTATVETHSGYELPWSMFQVIPFMCTTDFHDYHHQFHNKGNYGSALMLWDQVYGTNRHYYEWVQKGRPVMASGSTAGANEKNKEKES